MVRYVAEMLDMLADLVDAYVPPQDLANLPTEDARVAYLNMGQFAMWPRIYRTVESVVALDGSTEVYAPEECWGGRLSSVEAMVPDSADFVALADEHFTVLSGMVHTDKFRFPNAVAESLDTGQLRLTYAMPLEPTPVAPGTYDSVIYTGPDYTVEAPVLYAMSRIMARGLHSRLDYGRVSVDYNNRSAAPNELLQSAVYWLDEFERRVDYWQLVQPQSVR